MPFTSTKLFTDAFFAGQLSDLAPHTTSSFVNAESSAEVPFGIMLMQGTLDQDALLPTSQNAKLVGVLRHAQIYARLSAGGGELGTIGLIPKTTLGILEAGRIIVVVGEAVTPASDVRVRIDTNAGANGTATGPGTFCTTASATHTLNLSKFARFKGTTTGAGLVELELNMNMRNLALADT